LLPFGSTSIIIAFLLFAGLSLFLGRKNLKVARWPWKQILISELIFAVFFIVFLLIVREKPDIYFTGSNDGLFNTAFIQSILRGNYFPPPDPWFAGESIQYYYGEHVLVATFCWITKVPTTISFNIAVAMFPALGVCAAYGLGYNITKRKIYGFLALIFVCLIGYISGAFQLTAFALGHKFLGYSPSGCHNIGDWLLWFDFFHAHWLIDGAIVHYPYSAFLMGDLHAYSVSPSFQLMFIMLIFALFQKGRSQGQLGRTDTLVDIVVLALCLGFFFILNTWEYPTYIIFTVLAFILLRIRPTIKSTLVIPMAIIGLSFLLYLPYYLSGGMNSYPGFAIVETRTKLAHFAEFGALFLFVTISLLFILSKHEIFHSLKKILISAIVLSATILAAVFLGFQILIVVIPVGLLSLYFIYKAREKTENEFVLLLLLMGVAVALFCECFCTNDAYAGGVPWERFNTVMKFYFQLWVFLGIAAACAVFYVVSNLGRKTKAIWIFILALFIIASAIHPIASTTARLGGKYTEWGINKGTLDGMAYLEMVDESDYEAIRWINREIKGSPVMLELPWSESGRWSRVSSFTGLPTILGFNRYEKSWGHSEEELRERDEDADIIYSTLNNSEAMERLKKYNVRYIYIGTQEKKAYQSDGLQKFAAYPENYTVAYENEGVIIYEVDG
jgi:YYY domain-containing protein